jgi:uncharacterized protein with beta-barrel porin domain
VNQTYQGGRGGNGGNGNGNSGGGGGGSELGLRTDKSYAMPDGILTLRGRVAWAHDYDPNRSIGATFQSLPGASFVVGGAAQASESALVTAAAEKKWLNGWSGGGHLRGRVLPSHH